MRYRMFRGFDQENKVWRYGYYYEGVLTDDTKCLGDCRICRVIIVDGTFYHVDPDSVSQYTGMMDKDGLEIYEGDIMRFTYWWYDENEEAEGKLTGRIVYRCKSMSFLVNGGKNKQWRWFNGHEFGDEYLTSLSELMFNVDDFHVIGNIYENPELLEGDK